MTVEEAEIRRREQAARAAISKAYGTPDDEYGATLFVSHHLEQVEADYWQQHFGVAQPDGRRVLEFLELRKHWGVEDDDGIEIFDFTLPGDVTNYVITVHFDDDGEVESIAMES